MHCSEDGDKSVWEVSGQKRSRCSCRRGTGGGRRRCPKNSHPDSCIDVVIADECHRGYTTSEDSKWREVLNHFDAVKIGLTATPAQHTSAYFKNIVYHYPISRAVAEGYLVDWDLVKIKSDVKMNGFFLQEGEEVQVIDQRTGEKHLENLEDERQFDTASLEKDATAPESNRMIMSMRGMRVNLKKRTVS